jgi:hypothetical protein
MVVLQRPMTFCYQQFMAKRKIRFAPKRKRGRPPTTGIGILIGVRCHDAFLDRLDKWRTKQEGEVNRPEAIRRLAERGLKQG